MSSGAFSIGVACRQGRVRLRAVYGEGRGGRDGGEGPARRRAPAVFEGSAGTGATELSPP